MSRFFSILQTLVFIVFLGAPAVLPLLGVPAGRLAVENRPAAPQPPLDGLWDAPTGYGPALAAYIRDAAPFRDHLIRANSRLRLALFNESPVPGVIVGRDGWLFYNLESALDDYLNTMPLTEQALSDMVRIQVERRDWLAARGMTYLIVFPPNKERVYPEFMPKGLVPVHPLSRLGQLLPRLREAGISVLDLREPLLAAKAERQAFQKTDTHWNGWGAFRSAAALIDVVRQGRPQLPALLAADYAVVEEDRLGGDLAAMLLLPDIWRERELVVQKRSPALAHLAPDGAYPDPANHPDRARVTMETDRADWPRIVFFHDSFARTMIPHLAERCSRAVFLWSHAFAPAIIEAERPDVVVLEVVERYVYALTIENPEGVRGESSKTSN
jgi:alginate O-acetyltransferase complex protein AlgJ